MTDVFPQRNLPDQAEAWGREIEDRIKDIQKQVSVVSNTTRNTNLVAVKSAEAADHNVRRVEIQVEALEAAVNEKTRAVLDEAIEELREAEIVMEAQFEAHDTALGEAETAITEAQSELGALDGRITSAVQDAAALTSRVEEAEGALVSAQSAAASAQAAAEAAQTAAGNAQTAASNAQDVADQAAQDLLDLAGRTGRVIRSGTAPTGDDRNGNNLWLNTGTGQLHEWDGSAWTVITDDRLTAAANAADAAANAAANAQDAADTAQSTADAAASAAASAGSDAAAAQATATAAQSAASAAQSDASAAQSAASAAQGTADAAATAAADAAGIAGGKADVLIQATAPATAMRKDTTLWIDTTGGTNTPKRWSGSAWVAVTDKAATDAASAAAAAQGTANSAASAAAAAQSTADSAAAAAAGAQADADAAMGKATTADGRYTVATANPTAADATGKPEGAVWEVRAAGVAVRRYVLASGAWEQIKAGTEFIGDKAITRALIGDLAVGTAQIGDATVTNAKVGDLNAGKITAGVLDAARIGARSITAEKLVISPANVWPDPYFVETDAWPSTSGAMVTDPDMPGGTGLRITAQAAGQRGSYYRGSSTSSRFVQVEPGAQYRFRATVKQEGGPDPSGLSVYIRGYTADGTLRLVNTVIVPGGVEPGIFTVDEALPAIAGDVHGGVTVGIYTAGPHRDGKVFTVGGASLTRMADSSLIVDGGVLARHVQAESVAGAVGVFIDAMMQNLTVTGVANISTAVADQLYAKLAVVDKLQATSGIVTKDMIATGAITSEKIAANAVSAAMVDVGQNAKWDSNGLVFYAPPQPGQAYDDWENRTPLIQIRPDGSSSVQVGDSAGLHGGITPSGLVYGTAGDFETITVGGQDFATAVSEGPRGVISAVAPSNGINATTSNGPYLLTKFTPEPGRMYRITFGFKGGAASAENVLVADFRQARPGASGGGSASRRLAELVMLAARASGGSASGITHIDVGGDYLLADSTYLTDGETVIWIYVKTTAGTFYLNGAGSGQITSFPILKIEDIGVAYGVETQTVSSTSPPPPSKVTKTDYIWSGNAVGIRPDGSTAPDSRLTLGGYNTFGSDMAEFIWYPFNLSRLNGSTVNEALVQLTITQTYSGGQIAYYMDASTNRLSGRANLSQGWGGPGGSHDRIVPSGNLSRLIGKGGILIAPYNVGSTSSYGYFATKALMRVKYTK